MKADKRDEEENLEDDEDDEEEEDPFGKVQQSEDYLYHYRATPSHSSSAYRNPGQAYCEMVAGIIYEQGGELQVTIYVVYTF
jgi:hypothetical protein